MKYWLTVVDLDDDFSDQETISEIIENDGIDDRNAAHNFVSTPKETIIKDQLNIKFYFTFDRQRSKILIKKEIIVF